MEAVLSYLVVPCSIIQSFHPSSRWWLRLSTTCSSRTGINGHFCLFRVLLLFSENLNCPLHQFRVKQHMNLHHLCCAVRVVLHFQPCAPCFCDVWGCQSLIQPALPFWKTIRKGHGSAQCILALPDNVCCDIQQRTSVSDFSRSSLVK